MGRAASRNHNGPCRLSCPETFLQSTHTGPGTKVFSNTEQILVRTWMDPLVLALKGRGGNSSPLCQTPFQEGMGSRRPKQF